MFLFKPIAIKVFLKKCFQEKVSWKNFLLSHITGRDVQDHVTSSPQVKIVCYVWTEETRVNISSSVESKRAKVNLIILQNHSLGAPHLQIAIVLFRNVIFILPKTEMKMQQLFNGTDAKTSSNER